MSHRQQAACAIQTVLQTPNVRQSSASTGTGGRWRGNVHHQTPRAAQPACRNASVQAPRAYVGSSRQGVVPQVRVLVASLQKQAKCCAPCAVVPVKGSRLRPARVSRLTSASKPRGARPRLNEPSNAAGTATPEFEHTAGSDVRQRRGRCSRLRP